MCSISDVLYQFILLSIVVQFYKTSYNSVLRRLLGICKPYNASKMFVSRGIPTFAELLRTSIYRFAQRIELSLNCIISATLLPLMYISPPIRK